MRSKLIYGALRPLGNRYTLCQLASQATRRFHKPNTRIQDTMNEVLTRLAQVEAPERFTDLLLDFCAETEAVAA